VRVGKVNAAAGTEYTEGKGAGGEDKFFRGVGTKLADHFLFALFFIAMSVTIRDIL
jgi:hypothetical protein